MLLLFKTHLLRPEKEHGVIRQKKGWRASGRDAVMWRSPTVQSDWYKHCASLIVPDISLFGSHLPYATKKILIVRKQKFST